MNAQLTFARSSSHARVCQWCMKRMAVFPASSTAGNPQYCEACYHKMLLQAASINHRQPEPIEGTA